MKRCLFIISSILLLTDILFGQEKAKSDTTFKPSGKLWGYTFGDFFYKANTDTLKRGGANQYTGIEKGRNEFQIRRAYLGYNYDIHPKFSAELLLAAEDNVITENGTANGDLTINNKLTFFVKYANIRWKNIWKGTDLVVGQSATPAFSLVVEPVWGYRAIERTITDIRRTPSFDLGVSLQGKFDPATGNFGYNIMVGNGNGARPENDKFKWFYGEVYAKLFDKRIVLDLYADYLRLNWASSFHHSRNMIKGFAAYTTPAVTFGIEAFLNYNKHDVVGVHGNVNDTLSANAVGVSAFVRGMLIKDKLAYFARFDTYNPSTKYNETYYNAYKGFSANYDPNDKERFITAGLDFTPVKNIHFMPNIWYNRYVNQRTNARGLFKHDNDLVYRITFFYVYGR
jgi:hypothetical protein